LFAPCALLDVIYFIKRHKVLFFINLFIKLTYIARRVRMFGRRKFYKNFRSSFSFIKINSCFISL